MRSLLPILASLAFVHGIGHGQSTQALISGRVVDKLTRNPIAHATVKYESPSTNTQGSRQADANGFYTLPLLPPGVYSLTSTADDYQPCRYDLLEVPVAAVLDVQFALRRLSDIFDRNLFHNVHSGHLLNFYGPDVDTSRSVLVEPLHVGETRLDSSLSDVIDPLEIDSLPLTGRDIYTALLLQPGVTADPTATRGLGFAVNGQRPSSSSFLLDGVDAYDYLISGPLLTPVPEAVQEYRVSTGNTTAEFGGTTGYIANAVTRAGSSRWNGVLYLVGMNDALNANGFQENVSGFPRAPIKQIEPGFRVGGPVWRQLLFASGSFDYDRLRTRLDPLHYNLPTAETFAYPGNTEGGNLLRRYPAIDAPAGSAGTSRSVMLAPPSSLNQSLGLVRFDGQTPNGFHHFFLRGAISRFDRPDYYWTPYTDFTSGFHQNTLNIAAGAIDSLNEHAVNEARVAWSSGLLSINDNNHSLPSLGACSEVTLCLPSSASPYAYRNLGRTWQALDNLTWIRGGHIMKFGGGVLARDLTGYLRNGADGTFGFLSLSDFLNDSPFEYTVTVARHNNTQGPLTVPNYNREYRYDQLFFFAQDSWRVNDRLAMSYGIRYEYSGAPANVGPQKDDLIQLGPGSNMPATLIGAQFVAAPSGRQPLYASDPHGWAPRFGISWLPWSNLPILFLGSYGIFYDRPFDNLWQTVQNNSVVSASTVLTSGSIPYLQMAQSTLKSFPNLSVLGESFQPTLFQPNLRNPMLQTAFVGAQGRINQAVTIDVNAMGSRGRGILTTDFVNRDYSVPVVAGDPFGRFNPSLPPISYRANQGFSNFDAFTARVRLNLKNLHGQAAYTWSHAIDNQSDPIAGDYNLEFSSVSAGGSFYGRAAFVQQFNSGADRGNADFDQRHSLVFFVIAAIPAPRGRSWTARLLQNWQVVGLGSARSGLPFNAYAIQQPSPLSNLALIDNRADVVSPNTVYLREPYPGGARILNPAAFRTAADGQIGTAGRNAFSGPGTFSVNLSVSRGFPLPRIRESARLILRADAYNLLNHANLYVDAENPSFGYSDFGTAQFGTTGVQSTFPVQVPLTATPRQIQMQLRLEF